MIAKHGNALKRGIALLLTAGVFQVATAPTSAFADVTLENRLQFTRYDRRIDMAAIYSEILYNANLWVSHYIEGEVREIKDRFSTEASQQRFIKNVADHVARTGQPPSNESLDRLVKYPYEQMAGFDVAHRYCGGKVYSFFDTNDFKANLTAAQILYAPRLRGLRENKTYRRSSVHMLSTDSAGNRTLRDNQEREYRIAYDTCADELDGVPAKIPDGALVVVREAAVPFEVTQERVSKKYRYVHCAAPVPGERHKVGRIREIKRTVRSLNAKGVQIGDAVEHDWEVDADWCKYPFVKLIYDIEECEGPGMRRYVRYAVKKTDLTSDPNKPVTEWAFSDENGVLVDTVVRKMDMEIFDCGAGLPEQEDIAPTSDNTIWETASPSCDTIYPGYGGLDGSYEHRRTRRDVSYYVEVLKDTVNQTYYGAWERTYDNCQKITYSYSKETRSIPCKVGFEGTHIQTRDLRTTHYNFIRADYADQSRQEVTRDWYNSSFSCKLVPPPEPQRDDGGFDVNGDGIPDFNNESQAQNYVNQHGGKVQPTSQECNGACNGPREGSTGAGSGSGSGFWDSLKDLFGGNRGGGNDSGSNSCFARGTRIRMKDGRLKRIEDIKVGDELASGGRVLATMVFEGEALFDLRGTLVTGGHLVMHKGSWVDVRDHPEAIEIGLHPEVFGAQVYNLITEFNLIEIDDLLFADHAEVPVDALEEVLEVSEHETVQAMPNARYLDALMDVDIPVSAKTAGISTGLLSPRAGGFGAGTPLNLADGSSLEAKALVPGMVLAGGQRVTAIMKAKATWMVSLQHEGTAYSYSPASVILDDARIDHADHLQGPQDVIYIATHDHKITTPHGVMADFWISGARMQLINQSARAMEDEDV
jgi:hypothetical protein